DWQGRFLRKQFGNYIFKYQKERVKYEAKIMPYIKQEIFKEIERHEGMNTKLLILDAPTLIENNLQEQMDYVILVWVDKNTQIQRIKNRDKLVNSEILSRINSQMPLEDKKNYADFIIDNSGSLDSTKQQVSDIVDILEMYK
uniref:dephospho-CoA kinase n=1 Tax=Clostridium polynesiense TaxID=1325933 RepID=UPI00058E5C1F